MQRVVAAFPRQAPLPIEFKSDQEIERRSGIFSDISQSLAASQLAAAVALAVHRGLLEQPARKRLAIR
jgi:hypothetical protein